MKKIIITILVIILTVIIGWSLVSFWTSRQNSNEQNNGVVFPNGNTDFNPDSNYLSIENASGENIQTPNFLSDSDTVKDENNEGYYYLGNHFPTNDEIPSASPEYVIEYNAENNYFNIGLFQEPLGESRKNAENYLMQKLGLNEEQMCSLQYTVSTPYYVNEYLTSYDFRFSFCPGSFELP